MIEKILLFVLVYIALPLQIGAVLSMILLLIKDFYSFFRQKYYPKKKKIIKFHYLLDGVTIEFYNKDMPELIQKLTDKGIIIPVTVEEEVLH